MVKLTILGDSLSCSGYGVSKQYSWPMQCAKLLGCNVTLLVRAKGGIGFSSIAGEKVMHYYGCTKYFAEALHDDADSYVFFLGTNDSLAAHCNTKHVREGLKRMVDIIQASVKVTKGIKPSITLVSPPNILWNDQAEKRRKTIVVAVLKDLAISSHISFAEVTNLSAFDKHADGVHLTKLGASKVAKSMCDILKKKKLFKLPYLKEPKLTSHINDTDKRAAKLDASKMGNVAFFAMSRVQLRIFCDRHNIPVHGGLLADERQATVCKIGLNWSLAL
jgi:lysophospholipase L1-like esterase